MEPVGQEETAVFGLWGYAEADATIVGIVVAAVVLFAAVYVITRVMKHRNRAGAAPEPNNLVDKNG